MLSFLDAASVVESPSTVSNSRLEEMLTAAVQHRPAAELLALTHLLIVEPGDTEEAIVKEVGFTRLVNPLDRERYGSTSSAPYWDGLQDRGGWFELTLTVANEGFAFVLFIQDTEEVQAELLSLCRTYTGGQAPCTGFRSC